MEFKFFPWDNEDEKPYWTNPENGYEWYVDVDLTKWCSRWMQGDLKPLEAVVFYVCERKDGKVNPLERVLIDKKSNEVLASETSLEAMGMKIDALRFVRSFEK